MQMKREEVVMRMAKSPRECARAFGCMREIEARGSVPENRDASISPCKVNVRQSAVNFDRFRTIVESTQTLRKLFGPRKSRCVDFSRQVQRKR